MSKRLWMFGWESAINDSSCMFLLTNTVAKCGNLSHMLSRPWGVGPGIEGSVGDRVWLPVCCAVHESLWDRGIHDICGERGPHLRLWSHSPAS
jgi:hypothetical protein